MEPTSHHHFLTYEQCIYLLPDSFSNLRKKSGGMRIYTSDRSNLYFRSSKNYGYPNKRWWYSTDPKVVKNENISFLVLAADTIGIFLIPSYVFISYRDRHSVGAVKGGREDFTILEVGENYVRHEAKCEDEDLTKYFY